MRLPRDLSGDELARRLGRIGYTATRQTESHMRLTIGAPRQHHITIPRHLALRIGTLRDLEKLERKDRDIAIALIDALVTSRHVEQVSSRRRRSA